MAAQAADVPDQLVSFGDIAERDVFLEVSINGANTSQLLRFRDAQGRLSASADALRSVGIGVPGPDGAAGSPELRLDAIPGLRYSYNAATQSVNLVVPDALRTPYALDMRGVSRAPSATSGRGLVLNYDAYAQTSGLSRLSLYTEQRYFSPSGVFSNTGISYLGGRANLADGTGRYIRYDTYWTHSDQDTMRTLRLGDTITSSLDWSRSIRIAGVQWGRNFSLRPDLVTFPVAAISASSVVPSSIALYINGVQQYSSNVPAGPFVVNQIPGITGAGQATIVTRDALGRSIATTVPLYVDTRLLARGLSSYSVEAGFVRRRFSVRSFDYDHALAVSASGRYGLDDALTLEGHAESAPGVYNLGAGALVRLGEAGVVSASLAGSAGRYAGGQTSLGYQYVRPGFSLDMQATRALGGYGDLGSREQAPVARQIDRVTLSFPVAQSQSAALSYIGYRQPAALAARLGSATYTVNLHSRAVMSLSAFHDFNQSGSNGMYVSLTLMLGERTQAFASVSRQQRQDSYSVGAQRSVDYEGGAGWSVQRGRSGGQAYTQGQAQYLGRYGQLTGLAQDLGGRTQAAVQASGALVLMDGVVTPSRRINDSFALVSTGAPDVDVLHENRKLGKTDSSGHLLVPDLVPYQANRLSIDAENLPVDTRLESTKAVVVPQSRSGVVANFQLERYVAATVILKTPDGQFLPPGAGVLHAESGKRGVVGYDGMTFVEDLQALNHLTVRGKGVSCRAQFEYGAEPGRLMPTLGPYVCHPLEEPAQ